MVKEFLDNLGQVELSKDDLKGVSGGNEAVVYIEGQPVTEREFNDFILAITDEYGFDVAAEVAQEMINYPFAAGISHASWADKTDRDKMMVYLEEFWFIQRLGNYTPDIF